MEISQKSLERVELLCRNSIVSKILAGAGYGAAAYIYRPATIGDLELSSPQCLLLSLVNSLVKGEVMSCCMLADLCYQIQQFRSDYLKVWLVGDFVFPRQDIEKATALLSKLLASGILKLPSYVIKIMSSLAVNYGISCSELSSSVETFGNSAYQIYNAVIDNSIGDITDLTTKSGGLKESTQSRNKCNHSAASASRVSSSADLELTNSINVTPLEEAVKSDSAFSIKALLTAGAKVDQHFFGGDTYLHIAAAGGFNRALEALLEGGMNINVQNYKDETPLLQAIRKRNVQGMKALLKKGADINLLPKRVKSLLEMTIESQNVEMFKVFVKDRTDLKFKDGNTIFHLVARSGNAEMLKVISGWKLPAIIKNKDGQTPLHITSDPSLVRILIGMGVGVNEKDLTGETALHVASAKGSLELVRALIQQGADVNAQDQEGITAVMAALKNVKDDIVTLLLHNGAYPDTEDENGRTSLHYAAEKGNIVSLSTLLDAGATVNYKDNFDETPAFFAAENNKPRVLKVLIEHGSDLSLENRYYFNMLSVAAKRGHIEVVKILLDAGMAVEERKSQRNTALFDAAEDGHASVVSMLLDYGADPRFKREGSFTPLMDAAVAGRLDVVKVLIARGACLNDRNNDGKTALYLANERNYGVVADYLRSKGAIL